MPGLRVEWSHGSISLSVAAYGVLFAEISKSSQTLGFAAGKNVHMS